MYANAHIRTIVNRNTRDEETFLVFVDQYSSSSFEEFKYSLYLFDKLAIIFLQRLFKTRAGFENYLQQDFQGQLLDLTYGRGRPSLQDYFNFA